MCLRSSTIIPLQLVEVARLLKNHPSYFSDFPHLEWGAQKWKAVYNWRGVHRGSYKFQRFLAPRLGGNIIACRHIFSVECPTIILPWLASMMMS